MKIYLVCKNNPPDWNSTRVEVEDVVVKAYTTEKEAEEVRDILVHDDWQGANKCAIEHNARIDDAIALLAGTSISEFTIGLVLSAVGIERKPIVPVDAFRDNYFIHELEVEGDCTH